MHKRYWICKGACSKRFDDPEAFTGHLIRDHGTTDPSEALISEAEHVDGIETNGDCCLCGDKCNTLLELRDHLGEHQRQLALFALPPLESEEHEGVENSEEAARGHSSGNSTVGSEVQEDSDALAVGMEWEKVALPNTNIVQEREDRDLVESRAKEKAQTSHEPTQSELDSHVQDSLEKHSHNPSRRGTNYDAEEELQSIREELKADIQERLKKFGSQENQIRTTLKPESAKDLPVGLRPGNRCKLNHLHDHDHKPTYVKVHRDHLATETLTFYGLPWEWDRVS